MAMFKDVGIVGGLSTIYIAMVCTLVRVALIYRKEQRIYGSGARPHDGAEPPARRPH